VKNADVNDKQVSTQLSDELASKYFLLFQCLKKNFIESHFSVSNQFSTINEWWKYEYGYWRNIYRRI